MNEGDFSPDEVAQLRDIALQQRITQAGRDKDTYLSTGGMTAHDTLANFDKGQKSVDEFASKMFGGDTMRMARYRNAVALSRATTRKHLQSLADTEARQSAIASQKMTNDADLSVKLDSHVLEISTVTCAQDQAMGEQSEIFNSALATADGNLEEVIRQIQRDETLDDETKKKRVAEAQAAGIYMKSKASLENQGITSKIDQRSTLAAIGQVDDLSGWIRESFAKELEFQKSIGRTEAQAIDVAMESARNLANKYFTGRISRGQAEEAMVMLDEIERRSDEAFKTTKTFDPSRMMFCRHEDFKKMKDAAYTALRQVEERQLAVTANRQRVLGLHAEKVKDMAYKFGQGIDPYTGQPFDTSDMNAFSEIESKLNSEVSTLEKAGYLKTRQLYSAIRNEPRKERVMRERMNRLAQKAAAKQLVAEKESDIEAKIIELENRPDGLYTEEMELEGDDGKMKKATVTLDADRGICALIDEARSLGLCKGKTFTDIYNRHANTDRNLGILQEVVNQVFSYPSKGTNFDHGKWGNRDEQFGTTILLRKGENGSIVADNVSRYNRVKVGESAVGELWGTEDAYIDGASLKFVLDSANDYLNRSMAPSQEGLLKHMVAVRDNILKTKKAKDFQTGFVRDLATRFDAQFRDTPAWNYGGNQLLPAKAGEADFRRVRSLLPLSVRQKTRELKDAIISLSEKDGDGDMASVLREIPDYDNGTEE